MKASGGKVKKHSEGMPKAALTKGLLDWYDGHARRLPWRALKQETPDPYKVWLSEIMLQQTTVATVGPYFVKFLERWPTIEALAAAELDDVLRMWAGLGYYRRARLLHACALRIVEDFGGRFPDEEEALLALPGFGPYTAAAVAAIAFDRSANVVDGNVERVVSRMFLINEALPKAKPGIRVAAASLVPERRCGDYAQALMDLGAGVCTPRSPKCGLCPWEKWCLAKGEGVQDKLPRREKKKAKPARRAQAFVLMSPKGEVFLRRRSPHGLLAGMMEVPTSPWVEGPMLSLEEATAYAPVRAQWKAVPGVVRHVFTHFTLDIGVQTAVTRKRIEGHWVLPRDFKGEALPSVMMKVLRHAIAAI